MRMKDHSCVVYDRLKEITPVEKLDNLPIDNLSKNCRIAFEIIGYEPVNLDNSIKESLKFARDSGENYSLFEFIYLVWRNDNDLS